jgi:hypothetical protein
MNRLKRPLTNLQIYALLQMWNTSNGFWNSFFSHWSCGSVSITVRIMESLRHRGLVEYAGNIRYGGHRAYKITATGITEAVALHAQYNHLLPKP